MSTIEIFDKLYSLNTQTFELYYDQEISSTKSMGEVIKQLKKIQNLTQLQEFFLAGSQITKIPKEIKYLTLLQIFTICSCQISKIPKEIQYLTYLQMLDLSDNQISEIPKEIQYLTQLQTLNLNDNQIKVIPKEIQYLTQLQQLYLVSNQIKEISKEIQYLVQLQELNLSNNQITKISKEIKYLIQLQIFYLYDNQIKEIPKEIQYLTQLQNLSLAKNQITKIPEEIKYLTQLRELYLNNNQITKVFQEITYLTQLRQLYLGDNQITEIPLEIINLRNLRYLNYNNNPIDNLNNPIVHRFITRIRNRGGNIHNLYNDGQNIHSSLIQQSIKQSIINLLQEIKKPLDYDYLNDQIFTAETKMALTEYCNDSSVHSELECTFSDVLSAVLLEINKFSPNVQIEVKKRINEEMNDAECKCFTGRLSRIVNSLSGYSDKVIIKISSAEEIGNIITLMKSKYVSIDDIKNNVKKEMVDRGYADEIIDEWISYI